MWRVGRGGEDGKTEGVKEKMRREGETKRGERGGGEDGEQRESKA